MRTELGQALAEYGRKNRDVVVLDADASSSTMTKLFQAEHPERFFNVGIAEAGMIDTAVGLALGGKIPFAGAFAFVVCYRALESIRTSVAYAGAKPNMTVVNAADGLELKALVPAVEEHPGPVYLRISRADIPYSFQENESVEIGKGRIAGAGGDVSILVSGVLLHRALEARKLLAKRGISARLVEFHTLKPFDEELLIQCVEETPVLVTVEEHSVLGGLYGTVAEILTRARPTRVIPVAIKDAFSRTASNPETLWDFCGLGVEDIVRTVESALS